MAAGAAAFLPALIGTAADLGMFFVARHDANTAHQREVADLTKAGINPLYTAQTRGAPVVSPPPIGQDIQSGLNTALAIRAQASEIAQRKAAALASTASAASSTAGARLQNIQADVASSLANYQVQKAQGDAQAAQLQADKLAVMLPFVAVQARAEILQQSAGARQANALAVLNELATTGAVNRQHFDKSISTFGPWSEFLFEFLQNGISISKAVAP